MSHSQHDEELHISELAGEGPGTLLDIGAFDGKTFSNTLTLVERGWSGVLVEPSLAAFEALLERHGSNERLKLVHALVGLERGLVQFWNCNDGVSTTEAANYDRWREHARFDHPYMMPQVTIRDLIETFPFLKNLDLLSIDTEGTSAALFMKFPFELCRPRIVCVEFDEFADQVGECAEAQGYGLAYKSDENMVLSRRVGA